MAQASADYRKNELAADLDHYGATDTEYKLALASLSTMSADHLAALQAGNDTASDHELAMQVIANRRYADGEKAANDAAVIADKAAKDAQDAADVTHRADLVTALDDHITAITAQIVTADGDEKTALTTQLADLKTKRDTAYTATKVDLLAAIDKQITDAAKKIETASGDELRLLETHLAALQTKRDTAITNAATAEADAKIAQDAVDVTHRADLVKALDTHIANIVTAMETADTAEKLALICQLDALKTETRHCVCRH